MPAGSGSRSTSDNPALPLPKGAEKCLDISEFSTDDFETYFSRRELDRGSLFVMEGFVDQLEVKKNGD